MAPDNHPLFTTEPLGLIAGEGRFPFLVIEAAKRRDISVVALLIEGEADPGLEAIEGMESHWVALGELSRSVGILRSAGITRAILAGRVQHVKALQILRPDRLTFKVLSRLPSRTTEAMLSTVADVFSEEGIEIVDSTLLLEDHMAPEGALTRRKPARDEIDNVRFGATMARGLAALDIGQTVVVKRKAVVAAEAMEGTDRAVRRAAELTSGPFIVVKVARPRQDMRFDVPVVGTGTIRSMAAAGATVLGLEAGKVLLLDRDELVELADEEKIAIYGFGAD